jgi:5-methylcytosine-specific restriction endonuclease McrA
MPKRIPTFRPRGAPTKAQATQEYNRHGRDKTLLKLYSTARWQKFRAYIRSLRILCQRCSTNDRHVVGTHVDHIVDPRDNIDLAFDEDNVQLLCLACHNTVTAERARASGKR